jgi:hypothetical protein
MLLHAPASCAARQLGGGRHGPHASRPPERFLDAAVTHCSMVRAWTRLGGAPPAQTVVLLAGIVPSHAGRMARPRALPNPCYTLRTCIICRNLITTLEAGRMSTCLRGWSSTELRTTCTLSMRRCQPPMALVQRRLEASHPENAHGVPRGGLRLRAASAPAFEESSLSQPVLPAAPLRPPPDAMIVRVRRADARLCHLCCCLPPPALPPLPLAPALRVVHRLERIREDRNAHHGCCCLVAREAGARQRAEHTSCTFGGWVWRPHLRVKSTKAAAAAR